MFFPGRAADTGNSYSVGVAGLCGQALALCWWLPSPTWHGAHLGSYLTTEEVTSLVSPQVNGQCTRSLSKRKMSNGQTTQTLHLSECQLSVCYDF